MDEGKDKVLVAPKSSSSCFSGKGKGKVCFVCRSFLRRGDAVNFNGYHIFLVNLSELLLLDDGSKANYHDLQPAILLDFDDFCMSVYGLDSKLYFVKNTRSPKNLKVYYLDIQHHQKDEEIQHLGAADLRTLPPMLGYKSRAMITSIPGTKKILVFSSLYDVATFGPDWAGNGKEEVVDGDDDDAHDYVDFEMYDGVTNSWEMLPQIIIRADFTHTLSNPPYFLHRSGSDKRGTEIPRDAFPYPQTFNEFQILKYTFVHTETETLSLLVELSCGIMIMLDLGSPSKGWTLYNAARTVIKPPQANSFIVSDQYHNVWCLSDIGKKNRLASDEKFPLSSFFPLSTFGKGELVKSIIGSSLTPLEDEDEDDKKQYLCIVQGGVNKESKLPQVTMDVVDVQAKNIPPQAVASRRFGVATHKCKRFVPYCMFVYHP